MVSKIKSCLTVVTYIPSALFCISYLILLSTASLLEIERSCCLLLISLSTKTFRSASVSLAVIQIRLAPGIPCKTLTSSRQHINTLHKRDLRSCRSPHRTCRASCWLHSSTPSTRNVAPVASTILVRGISTSTISSWTSGRRLLGP